MHTNSALPSLYTSIHYTLCTRVYSLQRPPPYIYEGKEPEGPRTLARRTCRPLASMYSLQGTIYIISKTKDTRYLLPLACAVCATAVR
jgi:hypothetical protein